MLPAFGIVLSATTGNGGAWLKPKRSAIDDELPRAEARAERGEDRVAGPREGLLERAAAALVVGVGELDPGERREDCGGKLSLSFTSRFSSAPASVTILNVEPGGWTIENGTPA